MFKLDRFIEDCIQARNEGESHQAVREVVAALGRDIVHPATNPTEVLTSAIHVYGGDFFAPGRSEWDPETLRERPFDVDKARQIFAEANARFAALY